MRGLRLLRKNKFILLLLLNMKSMIRIWEMEKWKTEGTLSDGEGGV